jgi:hypothetical protein
VHAAAEVEPVFERDAADGSVVEGAVGLAAEANLDVAWEEGPDRHDHHRGDRQQAVLQIGHERYGGVGASVEPLTLRD